MTDREGEHRHTYLGYLFFVSHFLTRHFETLNKYFGSQGTRVILYMPTLSCSNDEWSTLVWKIWYQNRCVLEEWEWCLVPVVHCLVSSLSDCRRLSNHLGWLVNQLEFRPIPHLQLLLTNQILNSGVFDSMIKLFFCKSMALFTIPWTMPNSRV